MQESLVAVESVSKRYGNLLALNDVSLQVRRNEVVSIIGPSGSGKSTILRCIAGLEEIAAGRIAINGTVIQEAGPSGAASMADEVARSKLVGMVFQNFNLFPHMTAMENVTCGLRRVRGMAKEAAAEIARQLLGQVGLSDKLDSYPVFLSGGQQQRVAIARTLAMQPEVILLDEPTSALDPETVDEVLEVLKDLTRRDTTLILATHEMRFARDVSDRAIFMESGAIVEAAPASELFFSPRTERCAQFLRKFL